MRFGIAQASLALLSAFTIFDKKAPNTRLSKFLKPRSLPFVNDCFKNENNAVVGVFLQRLTNKNFINIEVKQAAWYKIYSLDGILVKSGALLNGKNQVVINNKGIFIYKIYNENSLFLSGKLLMY